MKSRTFAIIISDLFV